MSRSYKKNPFVTDHKRKHSKIAKRFANKSFRKQIEKEEEMSFRPRHKRYTESWDICDYKWRMTRSEAINWYLNECKNMYVYKRFPTLDKWLNYWEKCHKRK